MFKQRYTLVEVSEILKINDSSLLYYIAKLCKFKYLDDPGMGRNYKFDYISIYKLLQVYNAGISGNATSALETLETTLQEIKRQAAEVQSHSGIDETQNVQQELLSLYQNLEQSAYTLKEGLTTMDYYLLNQYVQVNNSLVESCESFLNNLQSLY